VAHVTCCPKHGELHDTLRVNGEKTLDEVLREIPWREPSGSISGLKGRTRIMFEFSFAAGERRGYWLQDALSNPQDAVWRPGKISAKQLRSLYAMIIRGLGRQFHLSTDSDYPASMQLGRFASLPNNCRATFNAYAEAILSYWSRVRLPKPVSRERTELLARILGWGQEKQSSKHRHRVRLILMRWPGNEDALEELANVYGRDFKYTRLVFLTKLQAQFAGVGTSAYDRLQAMVDRMPWSGCFDGETECFRPLKMRCLRRVSLGKV
jgi:hypothetical protein